MSRLPRRLTDAVLLAAMTALLASCTINRHQPCDVGQQSMTTEHLYFGTAKPDGLVSVEEWRDFLADTVTPRFPQGLSVWQASGQWQSEAGPIIQEPSYVLDIVHEESVVHEQAIVQIMNTYKERFQQEAVLRVKGSGCVSF